MEGVRRRPLPRHDPIPAKGAHGEIPLGQPVETLKDIVQAYASVTPTHQVTNYGTGSDLRQQG